MADPIKRYVTKIERLLRLDKPTRQRIMQELASDIQARQEAGETPEAILAEMGSAEEVAASFNAAFADHAAPRRSPLRWLLLLGAAIPLAETLMLGLFHLLLGVEGHAVGVIGGADGPTAVFVTTAVGPGAGVCQSLSLALACLAAFCLLQWPGGPGETLPRWKRLLPLVLAAVAAGLWLFALLTAPGIETTGYGLAALLVLVFALRRGRR